MLRSSSSPFWKPTMASPAPMVDDEQAGASFTVASEEEADGSRRAPVEPVTTMMAMSDQRHGHGRGIGDAPRRRARD